MSGVTISLRCRSIVIAPGSLRTRLMTRVRRVRAGGGQQKRTGLAEWDGPPVSLTVCPVASLENLGWL